MLRSRAVIAVTSRPSNSTLPSEGVTRPDTMFSNVDLPQPDGPSNAYAPPSSQTMLIGCNA